MNRGREAGPDQALAPPAVLGGGGLWALGVSLLPHHRGLGGLWSGPVPGAEAGGGGGLTGPQRRGARSADARAAGVWPTGGKAACRAD